MTAIAPPYITAWTGEVGYTIRPSPLVRGQPCLFSKTGTRGQGEPLWGKISEERQRECVVRRLCQVCHRPIRRGPGLSLVPLRPIQLAGQTRGASNEPLVCYACAPVSLRLCPALRRLVSSGVIQVLEVAEYTVALQAIQAVEPPPDEAGRSINEALREAGLSWCVGLADLVPERFRALAGDELAALTASEGT